MCGRFTHRVSWRELVEIYRITESQPALNLAPRYNVAPTQDVPVVRVKAGGGGCEVVLRRWGLIPSWAKDLSVHHPRDLTDSFVLYSFLTSPDSV